MLRVPAEIEDNEPPLVYAASVALRQFGDLEAQVMDRVWQHNRPVLVREILSDMTTDRQLAYTTILTVMERLCRKGWLHRQRRGKAYIYEAAASREYYTARLMCDALATSSNRTVSFVHFLEQLSGEEAAALRAALEFRDSGATQGVVTLRGESEGERVGVGERVGESAEAS